MLITLVLLVVAMKSGIFSSFLYSANEQVCRSWEGSTARQIAKLAGGNISCHRHHAQLLRIGVGWGQKAIGFSWFL